MGPVYFKLPVYSTQRTWSIGVYNSGAHGLALVYTAQVQPAHQPLERAVGHNNCFAVQLRPDFASARELRDGVPDPLDLQN